MDSTIAATPAAITKRPAQLMTPKARVGLIIPSSNRLCEPQMHYFAPPGLGVHIARLRSTGPWHRKISELGDDLKLAAGTLADSKCDLIVFNCTGGAMEEGPDAEAGAVEVIKRETGADAFATGEAVTAALAALAIRSLVLLTPYRQAVNDAERAYFATLGIKVVHDHGLNLSGGNEYIHVEPRRWLDLALPMMAEHPDADGLFLSCTNTTQIEIIPEVERVTGKPAVNSNQAVLWLACRRLAPKLGGMPRQPQLGRLFGNA